MRFTISVVLLSVAAVAGPPTLAAEPAPAKKPAPPAAAPKPHSVTDKADLEAFFDGILNEQLEYKHVAGAVVAVVAGKQVVFAKGYGFADVKARRPVDPETTQFRIASVSKLFVWTAVMQLVEEGKLDLDADVNTYLKTVKVPATFPQPITLKHLLTHTPGFEDNPVGLFSHRLDEVRPTEQALRTHLPARVRPPGVLPSYSNDGTALAAQVVADVCGKSYEEIVEQRLLAPLEMKHTLVRQPPADKLPATLSKGYKWKAGRFQDEGFEYISLAPAGVMSASAVDMMHFLLAHLNDGRYGQSRILKPETARVMRQPLFRGDPKVDAMCYGFWELHRNGQRVLEHAGDTIAFHSQFVMIPDRGVGLFVSYNTDRGAAARDEILSLFLDRYFPDPQLAWPKPSADAADLKRFAGEYGSTRHSHTTFAKLASMLGTNHVVANADGTLTVGSEPFLKRYAPVEPLVFQELYGPRRIVFRADEQGRITHMFYSDLAAIALLRRGFFETSRFFDALLESCAILFATALLFWPALALSTRRLASPFHTSRGSGVVSLFGWLLSAACLALVAGMKFGLDQQEELVYGTPRHLQYLLLLPQLCAVLAALVLVGCVIAWWNRYWRVCGRLHYTLVTMAGVAFVWFLHDANVLSFGLKSLSAIP